MSSVYSHIREEWKKPDTDLMRERMISWRKEPSVSKLERPTRLDRARSLGYKAKEGFLVARVKLLRGGRQRKQFKAGRKPRKMRRLEIINESYRLIAEKRANKKFHNFEVLNSYWVGKDGLHYWYEVILVDPHHPVIKSDSHINWILKQRGRVYRGLTSSSRRTRGLGGKGKGHEKMRPSRWANLKRKWMKAAKKGKQNRLLN